MITALSLAAAVAVGLCAYVALAQWMIAGGANPLWFVAGVPAALVAIPALIALAWFALSWWFRVPRPPETRLRPAALLRLYWGEVLAIAGSVPRMIGYRWLMADPPPVPAALPVLLLHGVGCNAGVWHPLKRHLAAQGIGPLYALSYGPPLASIERFAVQAAAKIDAILAATGAGQVVIVAHSMGGLVARAYLRREGGAKVRRLITIGTPHRGSMLATVFPGRSLAQMRPGNAWLSGLAAGQPAGTPIVSLWSWHDSMVAPQTSSVLEGAENVAYTGIAHNALLADPAVLHRVAEEIGRAARRVPLPVNPLRELGERHLLGGERRPCAPSFLPWAADESGNMLKAVLRRICVSRGATAWHDAHEDAQPRRDPHRTVDDRLDDEVGGLLRRERGNVLVDAGRRDHRRAHQRHVDGRERDALVDELRRGAGRERVERRLRSHVRGEARRVGQHADRRDVDDVAALALRSSSAGSP